jgi:hypothetical protein
MLRCSRPGEASEARVRRPARTWSAAPLLAGTPSSSFRRQSSSPVLSHHRSTAKPYRKSFSL